MVRIRDCVKNEFRLDIREKILFAVLIFSAAISGAVFIWMMPDDNVVGDSLALSSWATELFIILGVVLGYMQQNRETAEITELMESVNAFGVKKTGKIIWTLLTGSSVFAICAAISVIGLLRIGVPEVMYISSVLFILLYWIIPFTASIMASMTITEKIAGRIKYFLYVVVMIILGPLVPTIVSPLYYMQVTPLYKFFCIFNMAPLNTSKSLNLIFGYDLQSDKWIVSILLMFCFTAAYIRIGQRKIILRSCMTIAAITCLTASCLVNFRYMAGKLDTDVAYSIQKFYSKNTEKFKGSTDYHISEMNIKVSDGHKLSFDTEMTLIPEKDTDRIDLALYHDFSIQSISFDKYRVSGDVIELDRKFIAGQKYRIRLKYTGRPAAHMYSDTHEWFLPSYLAWYPMKGNSPNVIQGDGLYDLYFTEYDNDRTDFDIEYNGRGHIFSSLKETGKMHWSGNSNGVTLFCSSWVKKQILPDGTRVYYPLLVRGYDKYMPGFVSELKDTMRRLGDKTDRPDSIFITCDTTFTGYGERINLASDHCLFEINHGYADGRMLTGNLRKCLILEIYHKNAEDSY